MDQGDSSSHGGERTSPKRARVGPKLRLEVFKRDDFSCRYCGRKAGGGRSLEVDHVVPVSAGGGSEIENLATACTECNAGKGSRLLAEGTAPVPSHVSVGKLRRSLAKQREYVELQREQRRLREEQMEGFRRHWCARFGGHLSADGHWVCDDAWWPYDSVIESYLSRLGLNELLRAVDITFERGPRGAAARPRYLSGVLRNMAQEAGK